MNLLEALGIVCSAASLAGALGLNVPRGWRELLLPIAILGATAGIALGLLGGGALWMAGGVSLLSVGVFDASLVELVAQAYGSGTRMRAALSVANKQLMSGLASAIAMACFVAA